MKRKKLQESPSDKCVCGHERKDHYQMIYELDPALVAKLRKSHGVWFNEKNNSCSMGHNEDSVNDWCRCEKYLDMRHCKIKIDDPILNALSPRVPYGQQDLIEMSGASWATISRRIALFELLKLIDRQPFSGWFRSVYGYTLNLKRYHELRKRGIIQ